MLIILWHDLTLDFQQVIINLWQGLSQTFSKGVLAFLTNVWVWDKVAKVGKNLQFFELQNSSFHTSRKLQTVTNLATSQCISPI